MNARLALALAATVALGCVDLHKPAKVEECAKLGTCSDNPVSPQRDAKEDTGQISPDVPQGDSPVDRPDAALDLRSDDAPSEGGDAVAPDTKPFEDLAAPDLRTPDADTGAEVPADARRPDAGPDLVPDVGPDASPDLGRDVGPDLGPDLAPDTGTLFTGLLAYYKCEEATGTTLQDSSGKDNHGTLAAAAASGYAFRTGKVGTALALVKGGQGYVSLPAAMFRNSTAITVAAWVNVTTLESWARVFDVGIDAKLANNTATGTLYMNIVPKDQGTNLAFAISKDGYGSEQKLVTASPATGAWKHVAVVLGGTSGGLYVDGARVVDSSAVSLRPADLGAVDYAYLGKSQFTVDPYFDGQLDEVRIYDRALSAAEVKALYEFAGP